jgi:hypothetical protein
LIWRAALSVRVTAEGSVWGCVCVLIITGPSYQSQKGVSNHPANIALFWPAAPTAQSIPTHPGARAAIPVRSCHQGENDHPSSLTLLPVEGRRGPEFRDPLRHTVAPRSATVLKVSRSRHATICGPDIQVPRELATLLRLVCDTAALRSGTAGESRLIPNRALSDQRGLIHPCSPQRGRRWPKAG